VELLCGSVELLCGSVEPLCGSVELLCGSVELLCGSVEPLCGSVELLCGSVEPLCGSVELLCGSVELLCGSVGLRCRYVKDRRGSGSANDSLLVAIDNGPQWKVVRVITAQEVQSTWVKDSFRVSDYLTPTANMRLIFQTSDQYYSGHIVEAAVDQFSVLGSLMTAASQPQTIAAENSRLTAFPNPFEQELVVSCSFENPLAKTATLRLTSIMGQEVQTHALDESRGQLQLPIEVPAGVYLLWLENGTERHALKVIRQ